MVYRFRTYLQSKIEAHKCREQVYGHQRRRGGWLDGLGDWDWHIYITVYKIINENQLYSTGNSTQCFVVT